VASRIQDDIAGWLEFYRDLGIEEFYRREPGEEFVLPGPTTARVPAPELKIDAGSFTQPRPESQRPAANPATVPSQETLVHRSLAETRAAVLPRARALSLFEAPPPPRSGPETLDQIRADLGDCRRCKLAGGRKTIVFGEGNPRAELVFVGEGPGADEDQQGIPFVGKAGQLLTKMIEAMGFRREQVYIANVVKCRPPGNRNPEPDEIEACEPFLRRQIEAVGPRVIVALCKFAAQTLLRSTVAITRLRGTWSSYGGVKLMPTFHPAYLLRSPDEKKKAWADLQLVMAELGKRPPAAP
jgi:uracil-DNA glycosylase family 4